MEGIEQTGPQTTDQTGPQIVTRYGSEYLFSPLPKSYETYRTMKKDPTIALIRELGVAPIIASEWSVETDDDAPEGAKNLIESFIYDLREQFLDAALKGGCDFGWAGFEKIFALDADGYVVLRKLKPLLHDITQLLHDPATGAFAGYEQFTKRLPLDYCLHVPFRMEGTQWHGQSLLENARETFNQWRKANDGAERYDCKVAGSHFVIYFPLGKTKVEGGEEKPNYEIAKDILNAMESSGSVCVPRALSQFVKNIENGDPDKLGWKIEILEDHGGRQPTFVDRLKYLDAQKARALITPERAALEGEFGTKAEAGVHQELWITYLDLLHRHVVRHVNWYLVDQVLAANFGEEARGSVWVSPAPISDAQLSYLRSLYTEMIKSPTGFGEEYTRIDSGAIRSRLGVPEKPEAEALDEGEQPEPGLTDDQLGDVDEIAGDELPEIAADVGDFNLPF